MNLGQARQVLRDVPLPEATVYEVEGIPMVPAPPEPTFALPAVPATV